MIASALRHRALSFKVGSEFSGMGVADLEHDTVTLILISECDGLKCSSVD